MIQYVTMRDTAVSSLKLMATTALGSTDRVLVVEDLAKNDICRFVGFSSPRAHP